MSERPPAGVGTFFIVDANNFLYRAYHGLPMLTAPDGTPVNAVHGYVRMIQALRREFTPEFLIAVFDAPGGSFRNELYPEYKANRPPAPEDLQPQIPLVRQATDALSVRHTEVPGFEADDLIATYVRAAKGKGLETIIVSSDKDLMQLVSTEDGERSVRLWDTMKTRLIGPPEVKAKFGVLPERLGDLLALAGDSSDNIPGVGGIGPKTAATLLETFGDLEGILTRTDEIKQKKRRERLETEAEAARISRRLVALRDDVPLPLEIEELRDRGPQVEKMEAFFGPLGFKSVLTGATVNSGRRRGLSVDAGSALEPLEGQVFEPQKTVIVRREQEPSLQDLAKRLSDAGRFGLAVMVASEHASGGLAGIGVAVSSTEAYYIPMAHRALSDLPQTQYKVEEVLEVLGPLLADETLAKFAHGHKDQLVGLQAAGGELHGVFVDPMLASYLLDAARSSHDLEDLAKDLLSHKAIARDGVVGKGKKRVDFDQAPVDVAGPYAGESAALSLVLGEHLGSLVDKGGEEQKRLFHEIEMPLAGVLARLEQRGIALDSEELGRQGAELGETLAKLRAEIEQDAGYAINPDSPTQLQKLLFEDRGLPAKKKTKTGYSTDAQTLEELSLLDPIVKLILEYRSLIKLKGTYLDTLPKLVDSKTGRLHTHYRQAVAQTGRLSSRDPNLQNIPIRTELGRRIRRGFVAPRGMCLVALDYSQIELRVLAHMSKDPAMTGAFLDGADVHRRTASEVFDVPEAEVSDEQRRIAKAVNFGVIYGQTPFGLSRQLGIPQGKAGRYIKSYFEKIPGVDAFMTALIEQAKAVGYAETILGRRRRIPELRRRGAAKAYGERIARNTPIQGSAADILKIAMVRVERELEAVDWARMLLTVHDELIFECVDGREQELVGLVKPAMEQAAELSVPLTVDAGWGRTWAQAKG